MACVGGIGLEDAVGGGVVACGVHGVRARLVEGRWEAYITGDEVGDCDFTHGGCG